MLQVSKTVTKNTLREKTMKQTTYDEVVKLLTDHLGVASEDRRDTTPNVLMHVKELCRKDGESTSKTIVITGAGKTYAGQFQYNAVEDTLRFQVYRDGRTLPLYEYTGDQLVSTMYSPEHNGHPRVRTYIPSYSGGKIRMRMNSELVLTPDNLLNRGAIPVNPRHFIKELRETTFRCRGTVMDMMRELYDQLEHISRHEYMPRQMPAETLRRLHNGMVTIRMAMGVIINTDLETRFRVAVDMCGLLLNHPHEEFSAFFTANLYLRKLEQETLGKRVSEISAAVAGEGYHYFIGKEGRAPQVEVLAVREERDNEVRPARKGETPTAWGVYVLESDGAGQQRFMHRVDYQTPGEAFLAAVHLYHGPAE